MITFEFVSETPAGAVPMTMEVVDDKVTFRDRRHIFEGRPQLITSYYVSTLLGHQPGAGLALHLAHPAWTVDAKSMNSILSILNEI